MDEKENINVVNDQYGSPTYAADLAQVILKIIEHPEQLKGIYNYSNSGTTTWYEFAVKIKEIINSSCKTHPITTNQFPTPAKRPQFSSLDCTKIKKELHIKIPSWQNALERCLSILHKL